MSIYRELILDHANNPRNTGIIVKKTKTVLVFNSLCGDKVRMDIVFKNNRVADIKFIGQGCAISKAASSMLTEYAKGKKKKELKKLTKTDIMNLLKIDLGPNRVKCALLPLEALKKLLIT
ncbi:MAG: iron-sulfur cluster assembly scaffold protein [Patescibacteria group bacterium]